MAWVRTFHHTLLGLSGADHRRFLHGMVTNDIEALRPGAGCHAAMLTTKGKMLADLVVYCDADRLLLEFDGALREKIKGVFDRHIIMDDVEVTDHSDEVVQKGLYGEDAAALIATATGLPLAALASLPNYHFLTAGAIRVARAPELGLPGYHLFGDLTIEAEPLDDEAFEERRIEAGTPLYGIDMGEDRLPIEAGVTDAVSFTKGCYLGQEVIARATNLGHINRKLVGLWIDGEALPDRGAKLSATTRPEAGFITSTVRSRRFGRTIALGYVHRTLWDPGTRLALEDGRGVVVTALPFAATV